MLVRQNVPPAGILSGLEKETASLGEIVSHLERLYCGGIGLEVAQMTVKATVVVEVDCILCKILPINQYFHCH